MKNVLLLIAVLLALPTLGLAMDQETRERLEALEKRQSQFYTNLQEEKATGRELGWMDRFSLGGLIELEASYAKIDGEDDTSDITLATAELSVAAQVNKDVVAEILFLAEEDDGIDLSVDEAFLAYKEGVAVAGLFYVPFGTYNSYMVTDPLTLELGESQEVALMGGFSNDLISVAAFVYNGDADEQGKDNHIVDLGASLVLTPVAGFECGVSLIKDLADSDMLTDELGGSFTDEVAGISAYGLIERGPFAFTAEVVAALSDFDAADDVAGDGSEAQPVAYNAEAAYSPMDALTLAARFGGSNDVASQNETQYGVAVSYGVMDHVTIAAEYLHGDNVDNTDQDTLTVQLAAEF